MADLRYHFPFDRRENQRAISATLKHGSFRWLLRGLAVFAAILLVLAGLEAVRGGGGLIGGAVSALPWLLLGLFWTVGFTHLMPWWATRVLERKMKAFAGDQVRAITSSHFKNITAGTSQELSWSAIVRIVETDEFILLYVKQQCRVPYSTARRASRRLAGASRGSQGRTR